MSFFEELDARNKENYEKLKKQFPYTVQLIKDFKINRFKKT